MQTFTVIVGGWLAVNVVVFIALMLRRDRAGLRARLFDWVVKTPSRRAQKAKPASDASEQVGRAAPPIR